MNLRQAIEQLKKTNKELKECIDPGADKSDAKIIQMVPKEIIITKDKAAIKVKEK